MWSKEKHKPDKSHWSCNNSKGKWQDRCCLRDSSWKGKSGMSKHWSWRNTHKERYISRSCKKSYLRSIHSDRLKCKWSCEGKEQWCWSSMKYSWYRWLSKSCRLMSSLGRYHSLQKCQQSHRSDNKLLNPTHNHCCKQYRSQAYYFHHNSCNFADNYRKYDWLYWDRWSN